MTFSKFIYSLILAFLMLEGYAQSAQYSHPSYDKVKLTTGAIARDITRHANTDREKVAAIFNWITAHIDYDHELQNDRKLQKQFYTSEAMVIRKALERKKALCGGYAFLFDEFCKRVGISSVVIHGYSKKYYKKVPKDAPVDHTWNAVKLNGKWHLLDITYARSHQSGKGSETFWFLTRPEDFIYSHYPEDPKWTLLNKPVSKSDFFGSATH